MTKHNLSKGAIFAFSFLWIAFFSQNILYGQTYCAAGNTDCGFEYVTNVNVSNLNNTSACDAFYDDFTNQVATMQLGQSYSGQATKNGILGNYILAIFVDWDRNGTFDPTEKTTATLAGTSVYNYTLTPPVTATVGPCRMRVRMGQSNVVDACDTLDRGDTEDYTIMLTTTPPPAPANDNCSNAINITPTSGCPNIGGTTIGATQNFVPSPCGNAANANDVWYSFIATGLAEYIVSVTGSGTGSSLFNPVLALYSSCNEADFIACADATLGNQTEQISTGQLAAGTYYYRIYGNGGNGNFTTCVTDITPMPGDDCDAPLVITDPTNFCSPNNFYNNIGAITSSYGAATCWTNTTNDVWLEFTATAINVEIDVFGLGNDNNTLQNPQIALYSGACVGLLLGEGCAVTTPTVNASKLAIGGLTVGTTYLIRVDGGDGETGTFQFCIQNFNPVTQPGQDCGTARLLCDLSTIEETAITGYGDDGFEAANSCLAAGVGTGAVTEQNSTWYTWTAGNNGTLGFDIIPAASNPNLDIDFVLYQFDPVTGCDGRTQIRCEAASCPGATGLNATSVDIVEPFDCNPPNDNYLMQLTMTPGTTYGLLVNNFQSAASGYTIQFNGTAEFQGPVAAFDTTMNVVCGGATTITYTDNSTNAVDYLWNFGSGATPATATTPGPHAVTYTTTGIKTAALTVTSGSGCDSTIFIQFNINPALSATAIIVNSTCGQADGSIAVNATGGYHDPLNYQYKLDNGAYQSNSNFTGLLAGVYDVTVLDETGCEFTFTAEVFSAQPPVIDPINDVVICDSFVLTNITGNNLSGNEAYYTMNNGAGNQYLPGDVLTASQTLYAYDGSSPSCFDEVSFLLTINETPSISNLVEACQNGATEYVLSFDISGGDSASYAVVVIAPGGLTGTLTGSTWTSDPIPSNTPYEIEVDDANPCEPLTIIGNRNCLCNSFAGTMNTTPQSICGEDPITATHNTGTEINDGDDIFQFVLHTSSNSTLGNIEQTSNTPTFAFAAPMVYGTTYYISAIIGSDDGTGNVDLNDPCLSVAAGTPVTWNDSPVANASVAQSPICEGENLEFLTSGNTSTTYAWSGPNGYTSSDQNPIITSATANASGTYTVVATSTNGCSATSTVDAIVSVTPHTTISGDPAGPFCDTEDPVQFSAATTGGTWTGTGITDQINGDFDPMIAGPGDHLITYSIDGNCPSTSERTVTVNETPIPTFDASATTGCAPHMVSFVNTTADATSANWTFGDGQSGTSTNSISHTYVEGTYDLTLTVTTNGCTSSITESNYITANPTPVAGFNAENFLGDGQFVFENTTTNGTQYLWDFGNGNTSTLESPAYDYGNMTGTFVVTLIASSNAGCTSTYSTTINIDGGVIFYVPNSFTPDGNGVNQTFAPVLTEGIDMTSYTMTIFNRWGEPLFETRDINIGWDGTFTNQMVQQGIYTWSIQFSSRETDQKFKIEGSLQLLR